MTVHSEAVLEYIKPSSSVAITNFKCSKYKDVHECPRKTCTNCINHVEYVIKEIRNKQKEILKNAT